jgi:hypothetical protein
MTESSPKRLHLLIVCHWVLPSEGLKRKSYCDTKQAAALGFLTCMSSPRALGGTHGCSQVSWALKHVHRCKITNTKLAKALADSC